MPKEGKPMPHRSFKTALVLSGGSARGLAHLGVLCELERHKIPVDIIVGTSMGALIGGLYALHGDAERVNREIRKLTESDLFLKTISVAREDAPELGPDGFFNRFMWLFRKGVYYTHSMIRPALVPEEVYSQIMSDLIPDRLIESLPTAFAAVTMDLMTGEEIVLTKGSLRMAIAASAAIPGILPPVEMDGRTLVDGGWVDNTPAAPAIAMGAHLVLAVDTTLDIPGLGPLPFSAMESIFRCNEITRILLNRHRRVPADVLLVPKMGQLFWANFSAMERCREAGKEAFRENLPKFIQKKRIRRCLSLSGLRHPARRSDWHHPFVFL